MSRIYIIVFATTFLGTSALTASRPAADHPECHAQVARLLERGNIPGLQVAVAVDGDLAWSDAIGYANLETKSPVTTTTKFRIASVTKTLTGTLAARLATQGRLDLDAPVHAALPDYPRHGRGITARYLAGHLSGIRHYEGDEMESAIAYPLLQSALVIFMNDPLKHTPGAQREYSTYGFTLLGVLMEIATDTEFTTLMKGELLDPLGMVHTVAEVSGTVDPACTTFYRFASDGSVVRAAPTDHSYKTPGGGYLSTAEDLVCFGSAIAIPGYFDKKTIDLALAAVPGRNGRTFRYGMGWEMGTAPDGSRWVGHRGTQHGARSYLYVSPKHDVVVAILTNVTAAPMDRPDAQRIAQHFIAMKK